jgi:hypothetical protein
MKGAGGCRRWEEAENLRAKKNAEKGRGKTGRD